MKHRSDLKHASMARARAEDKENDARKDVKVVEDELRLAREELQVVKGDLWAKVERARQEALEADNSMERLTEELDRLRMDLERKEALVSRRGEVIVELRYEACTQWASGLLAFQCKTSRAFPDLEFNIQLNDDEVEESTSEAGSNVGTEVFSGAPDRASLPADPRDTLDAISFASLAEAPPFNSSIFPSRGLTLGA